MDENIGFEYAGFWIRVLATIIDTLLIAILILPLLFAIYGADGYLNFLSYSDETFAGPMDFILQFVLPAFAVILFWVYRQATPGKMAISAKIVDAETGKKPSTGQCVGRYFAYIPSMLFLGLGVLWVAFDERKQGWHDKLAGTVVIKRKRSPVPLSSQT